LNDCEGKPFRISCKGGTLSQRAKETLRWYFEKVLNEQYQGAVLTLLIIEDP